MTLDSDGIIQIVYVILALASAVYSKLEVTLSHAKRNLVRSALDAQLALKSTGGRSSGSGRSGDGVCRSTSVIVQLEGTHQLQGAADFTGLLILILTTAGQQAGTSHSHGSGGAVLQERAAVEF